MAKTPEWQDPDVVNYWIEYYVDEICTLCGNTGVIDTRGMKSATGRDIGRENHCICPNGQSRRHHAT